MAGKALRTVLTIVVDILIVVALALAARLVILFFGRLSHQAWAQAYTALTSRIVLPFGLKQIRTPYGGVFDVNSALSVVVFVFAEWPLSALRDRA